jgi:hypothetical protein
MQTINDLDRGRLLPTASSVYGATAKMRVIRYDAARRRWVTPGTADRLRRTTTRSAS